MRSFPRRGSVGIALALALVWAPWDSPARAAELRPAPEGTRLRDIVRRADWSLHGERTHLEGSIAFETAGGDVEQTLRFRAFDDRLADRSFLRVDGEEGASFLNLPPNLWSFDRESEQTLRLPDSVLREPLLGSAFTLDALLGVARLAEDYRHELLGIDPQPEGMEGLEAYVVVYLPKRLDATLWPRIVARIDTRLGTPLRHEYFDRAGERVRIVDFGAIRQVGARHYPHVWFARTDEPKRRTRIQIDGVVFDTEIDAEIFTPRHLKATR